MSIGKQVNYRAYAPIITFTLVYATTCLVGALLLMTDFRPYAALFEYFSGFVAPRRPDLVPLQLSLLLAAPALMWLGYVVATRIRVPRVANALTFGDSRGWRGPSWVPHAVFYPLALVAFVSLTGFGSTDQWRAWFDPQATIDARYQAFRAIPFAGFVNIYTLVPLAAAWIVVSDRGSTPRSYVFRWLPVVGALVLLLMLFQKRPALNALILVFAAAIIALERTNVSRARLAIVGGVGALILAYLSLVMIPAYFDTDFALSNPTANSEYPVSERVVRATHERPQPVRLREASRGA